MFFLSSLGVCLSVLAGADAAPGEEPTFAERLGWPKGTRAVIFHVDDAGMSPSSNQGSFEAVTQGVATSVSTMVPCPEAKAWADMLREHPDVDNGVHLTLTSEWKTYRWKPLTEDTPGLLDPDGFMWHEVPQVVASASAEEVGKEIRAQLAKAEELGLPITHLDSHMGTLFAKPEFFLQYMQLGVEKGIPILIAGGHLAYVMKENPEAAAALKSLGVTEAVWDAGLPVIDDIHTGNYGPDAAVYKEKLIEFLRTMNPGITQFIVHCTRPGAEFAGITGSGPTRFAELQVMLDPEVKKAIEEEGIVLTTWRELKERRDSVKLTAATAKPAPEEPAADTEAAEPPEAADGVKAETRPASAGDGPARQAATAGRPAPPVPRSNRGSLIVLALPAALLGCAIGLIIWMGRG